MMGVGKSTLGKIVAKKLNLKFIDIDSIIEKKYAMKIWEIFNSKGEGFFRLEEEKETLECLKKNNTVIALGGGAFMNKNIRNSVLKNSLSLWLDVSHKTITNRVRWNKKRPLLKKENTEVAIKKIYFERKNTYKLANYKINCNNLTKESISKKIILFYENYKIKN